MCWGSRAEVCALGDGLMVPTPGGPGQGLLGIGHAGPDDGEQEAADFRLGERDQIHGVFFCPR